MTDPVPAIRAGLFVTDEEHGVRLVTGRCDRCDRPHFPRTDSCPYCGGPISERLAGPGGVVSLATVVRRRPPGYAGPVPYGFGVVRLDGTRLEVVSRIAAEDPGAVRPGAPVRLALEQVPTQDGAPATVWTFRAAHP
jgi:uncharacterized OB-fold protein